LSGGSRVAATEKTLRISQNCCSKATSFVAFRFLTEHICSYDHYYVAYLKDDPAREPVVTSDSSPGVLADAAHKIGRAKADFELREIGREEYERLKLLLL
jgi:hypothetical protein